MNATDVSDADPDEAEALVEALKGLAAATRTLHAAAKKRYVVADAD